MKIKLCAILFLFVALTLSCCQTVEDTTEADVAAIRALVEAWNTAAKAGDAEGVIALYTDDIVDMPSGMPSARGIETIGEIFRDGFKQFSIELTWPVEGTEEIIVAGDWAFHLSEYVERFTIKASGETTVDHGKIVMICRKQPDGSWKFARQMWNLNGPTEKE